MRRASMLVGLLVACDSGRISVDDGGDGAIDDTDVVVETDVGGETDGGGGGGGDTDPLPQDTDTTPELDACGPGDGVVPDLTQRGPAGWKKQDGRTDVPGDCTVPWIRYSPRNGTPADTAIVLTHGFQRSTDQVAGWAQQLASWGFEVLTPAVCHASFWDADHVKNSDELVSLAASEFAGRPVMFIGHSAGGLASALAGGKSPQATAVFGLDLVDMDDLARKAAPSLQIPFWGVVGKPYTCNSDGNGRAAYDAAPDGRWLVISDASHCDFEDATDWACTTPCEGLGFQSRFTDAQQRSAIRVLLTSFVMMQSGVEPDAVTWWQDGCDGREQLRSLGLVR